MRSSRWTAALVLAWTLAPAMAQTAADKGAPQPYGPVLTVNGKPVADAARRDPAEVHDEADSGAHPAATTAAAPSQARPQAQQAQRRQQAARRRPAAQDENEPMAPRPLRADEARAAGSLTIAPPPAAPQPMAPSSSVINGCQGSFCTDASGKSYNMNGNGSGNAGVDSSGRLCTRTGATVQCF